jgi:hypothetical protein
MANRTRGNCAPFRTKLGRLSQGKRFANSEFQMPRAWMLSTQEALKEMGDSAANPHYAGRSSRLSSLV